MFLFNFENRAENGHIKGINFVESLPFCSYPMIRPLYAEFIFHGSTDESIFKRKTFALC